MILDLRQLANQSASPFFPLSPDELNTWSQSGTLRMLRNGDWKLVYDMHGNGQLYNFVKDSAEVNNLFGKKDYAGIQTELVSDLLTWELRMQDPLPYPHKSGKR